jgi:hypothetical protein
MPHLAMAGTVRLLFQMGFKTFGMWAYLIEPITGLYDDIDESSLGQHFPQVIGSLGSKYNTIAVFERPLGLGVTTEISLVCLTWKAARW